MIDGSYGRLKDWEIIRGCQFPETRISTGLGRLQINGLQQSYTFIVVHLETSRQCTSHTYVFSLCLLATGFFSSSVP